MQLHPCLFVTGNAEEMLEFYRDALGGDLEIHRYKDAPPEAQSAPEWGEKVMYGALNSPFGTVAVMDAPLGRAGAVGDNFGISIVADTDDAGANAFAKLANGGEVGMPYGPAFFAEKFGMLDDKYGVHWMVSYGVAPVGSAS